MRALRQAEAAWNAAPTPRRLATPSFWKLINYAVIAFAVSFLVPAFIVLAPDFGRAYACAWKAVLGYNDCFTPPSRRGPGKRQDRLPSPSHPPADNMPPLQEKARP